MMESRNQDLDTDAAIDPERGGTATALADDQQQAPADQQKVSPVRHHNFPGVQPTMEHYDVAIAFAEGDEEIADDIMTKMSNLELHDGTKPKVCLFDRSQFTGNKVAKAKKILKVCTLIYIVLTENFTEDVVATLFKDEAIAMTRLAPKDEQDEERRHCVRPLHTLSKKERKGVYTVPEGLYSVDSLDWYKFGKPLFNEKLVELFEYYLPYRQQRESHDSSGRLKTANDLKTFASDVGTINHDNPSVQASSAFQQTGHSYQHPYVSPPTHQASTPNPSGHSPSNSNTQGHGGAFSNPPNISSHQQGVLENQRRQVLHQESTTGSTATGGPSQTNDDHSMRLQPKEEAPATSSNNLSNTTQAFSQTAQLRNQANNNQFQKPSTSHLELQEANQHSGTGNQSQDPNTDRHHVGSRGSVAVHQTPDSEGENVPISTHSARVGGDSDPVHCVDTSDQPRRSTNVDQEMPNPAQTNDPQLSDLPTEVDKDSGMGSLSKTSLRTEAASEETESSSGQPSTASVDGDCSMTSSQGESSEKQSCPPTLAECSERTPGDRQDFEDQPDKYDKSKVTSSSTCVPKKLSRRSSDDDDISQTAAELRGTSSGPAYRSVKYGSPNDAHPAQGIRHTDIPPPPQVVHHFHHLTPGHYDGQSNDPNLFLPDHLIRDFTPFRVPDAGHPRVRSTAAQQDRIGERNVTLEATAPINVVNCHNVQIGQGQIFERPEPDISLEHQESDDSSSEADISAEPPPPYSQHDPCQGMATESPSTNVKQVVQASQATPAGPVRYPQEHVRIESENPTLARSQQTVDRTTREDRQPTGTQQQSVATGPHGEENLPPGEPSGQDHIGMIQDCAPSMPMASGQSIDLMNQGEGQGQRTAMSELEAFGDISPERRLQLKRGCPDMSDPDHVGHQPHGEIESFQDDATSFSVSLPDDGRDLFEFMKNP